MESRRLHLAAGFPSLFAYCTAFLRLSEYEAFNRIEAARAARRFPRVLAMLAEGSLTLTTAQLVGRHLTDENHAVLLSAAAGKSKLEVQELLARHQPRPAVPASVRRLPDRAVAPAALLGEAVLALGAPAAPVAADAGETLAAPAAETAAPAVVATPRAPSPPRYRPPVTPLAPDRYQFTFTGSRETRELLDLAQDMLRHAIPGGDTGEIMKRALEALVRELARKKFAATTRPRKGTGGMKDPGEPSAAARREVWIRDRGRCAYVAGDGRRCNERFFTRILILGAVSDLRRSERRVPSFGPNAWPTAPYTTRRFGFLPAKHARCRDRPEPSSPTGGGATPSFASYVIALRPLATA